MANRGLHGHVSREEILAPQIDLQCLAKILRPAFGENSSLFPDLATAQPLKHGCPHPYALFSKVSRACGKFIAWPPLQILVVKEKVEVALENAFEIAGAKLRKVPVKQF